MSMSQENIDSNQSLSKQVTDLATGFALQKQEIVNIRADITQLTVAVHGFMERANAQGKTNWSSLAGIGVFLFTVMMGVVGWAWFSISQNVAVALSPIRSDQVRFQENQEHHDETINKHTEELEHQATLILQNAEGEQRDAINITGLQQRVTQAEQTSAANLAERKEETAHLEEQVIAGQVGLQWMEKFTAINWNKAHPGEPYPYGGYNSFDLGTKRIP